MDDKFVENDDIIKNDDIIENNYEDIEFVDEDEINSINERFFQAINEMNELNDNTGENKIVTVDDLDIVTDEEIASFKRILASINEGNNPDVSKEFEHISDDEIKELLLSIKMNMNGDYDMTDYMSEEEKIEYDARNEFIAQRQEEILKSMNKPVNASIDDFDEKEMYEYLKKCIEVSEEYDKMKGNK